MDLKFQIQYKKGVSNAAADALSRHPDNMVVAAISTSIPSWLQKLQEGYEDDPHTKQLLTELSISFENDKGFTLQDGVLRFKGRVWVGDNQLAQNHILQALHSSSIGGHSGIHATSHRIKSLFARPHLKATVTAFVQSCDICQKAKVEHVKLPGLLQPLPVPSQAWSTVCLDFIEGLPKFGNSNVILVVIDKFSKYAHFVPLSRPYTTLQVAQAYFKNIYKLHDLPQAIISDRDPIFTSTLWKELFTLSDTKLLMSSSYHPQTDGQTERLNQCLEAFLRCSVHSFPSKWSRWLPLAEFWYNTSFQSAIGRTPFEVLYGYPPRQLGIVDPNECTVPDLADWLKERASLTAMIQQQLLQAQQRMKSQADQHRSERAFEIGDLVYLKLQPYVQSTVATCSCHKLSFRFYGPYKIIQKVGEVAYKLDLPPGSHIHSVIHVSQLKKHVPACQEVFTDLTSVHSPDVDSMEPICVLDSRLIPHAGASAARIIV